MPISGQNWWFVVPCDLEISRMTLKNNRAHLLCYFKLCASFRSHFLIQTGVTVRKHPIRFKISNFLSCVTPLLCHIKLCASFNSHVNSNWSYSPDRAKLGFDFYNSDMFITNKYVNSEYLFIHGIPESILKETPMPAECGYKCSSYHINNLKTTSIGMNMTKQLVLTQIYIFVNCDFNTENYW